MKELKDLVEGDEVLVTGMSHRHIAKVDKVTKLITLDSEEILAGNAVVIDGMLEEYLFLQKRKYQMLKKRIFVRLSSTLSVLLISNAYQQMS